MDDLDDIAREVIESVGLDESDYFELDGDLATASAIEIAAAIADAWCRHQELRRDIALDDEPTWWSLDLLMHNDIYAERYRGVLPEILLALVARADDDDTLGLVGAWPLENFVSDLPADVEWLEHECRDNRRLRRALSHSWYSHDVSVDTNRRLDAARREPMV